MNPLLRPLEPADTSTIVVALCLALLALAHSLLGERLLLRPLLADKTWGSTLSRPAADGLLRAAWHLTSLFWLAMAAVYVGAPWSVALGVALLLCGGAVFVVRRAHLSWPLFAVAGLASFDVAGFLPAVVAYGVMALATLTTIVAALLHVYWATGRGDDMAVIPTRADATPLFKPGPAACLVVAFALAVFAALLVLVGLNPSPWWGRACLAIATAVLALRAVGDGRYVGFLKTERRSPFARLDDRIFTPLVVLLAMGGLASLRLATPI